MTKEQQIEKAQAEANQCGKTIALLNLNTFGRPLYVQRYWNDVYATSRELVARCDPIEQKR